MVTTKQFDAIILLYRLGMDNDFRAEQNKQGLEGGD